MKGSIRFNNDINVEVDVDPTAAEGSRLTGAKNLVDGQELGTGGDVDYGLIRYSDDSINKNYNELKAMLEAGIVPHYIVIYEEDGDVLVWNYTLVELLYSSGTYTARFVYYTDTWYSSAFIADSATGTMIED